MSQDVDASAALLARTLADAGAAIVARTLADASAAGHRLWRRPPPHAHEGGRPV